MKYGTKYDLGDWDSIHNPASQRFNWWHDDLKMIGGIGLRGQLDNTWSPSFYGSSLRELEYIYMDFYGPYYQSDIKFASVEEGKAHIDKFLSKYSKLLIFI